MTVFRYELLQLRTRILVWSLVLAGLIFMSLPVYVEMISGAVTLEIASLQNAEFYEMFGTSIEILRTPVGTYSFLTSFMLYAVAVHGMSLGIGMFTKEYRNNTSEFLLTKPYSRVRVYAEKLSAALTAGGVIGVSYTVASLAAMGISTGETWSRGVLVMIGLSTVLVFAFFLAIGFLIGVLAPGLRSAVAVSAAAAFFTYVFQAFSHKTGIEIIGYLSPYVYFEGTDIITRSGYDAGRFVLFVVLVTALLLAGARIYTGRDIRQLS